MKGVAAIVLAAGASTRLGRPKQLVTIGTENLLERAIRMAKDAGCSPVVVVLGAYAELICAQSELDGVEVVVNQDWQEGMASSIRAGVSALNEAEGVVLMVCDMPAVTPTHLRALAATGELTASSYAGKSGVPAYLPRSAFATLMDLRGDSGARSLLQSASSRELPGGEMDIDTEIDIEKALRSFG